MTALMLKALAVVLSIVRAREAQKSVERMLGRLEERESRRRQDDEARRKMASEKDVSSGDLASSLRKGSRRFGEPDEWDHF